MLHLKDKNIWLEFFEAINYNSLFMSFKLQLIYNINPYKILFFI